MGYVDRVFCRLTGLRLEELTHKLLSMAVSLFQLGVGKEGAVLHKGVICAGSVVLEVNEKRLVVVKVEKKAVLNVSGIEHKQVLDLSDDGERWEGDVLDNQPYGWGVLYDSENRRAYEGFRIGEVNVCYGTQYYSDIQKVEYEGEWLVCRRERVPKTVKIRFSYPSVGATENLLLFHASGNSDVVLENTAREPEICSLCEMLRDMGAKINGETTGTIHICGAGKLHGTEVTIPGDRIVFMTYAAMALGTQGKIRIRTEKESFLPERKELEKSGCFFAQDAEGVLAEGNQGIHPIPYLKTAPYPGFPTDAQSLFLTLLSRAHGESILCETVFENRFQMIPYLKKMGADIDTVAKCAYINGVTKLHGETVQATDLRSGAAILLAGAMAEGETIVQQAENILRGYENPIQNMRNIGLCVH